MKTVVPSYYKNFTCIADRCRHNCCIGWEIDIDESTLEMYKSISGKFGERLRSGINTGVAPCFKLCEDDRCVFLNNRGLCDIILNLGEDALCDICADHPRFRNFYSDRTEIGLGLCCEEACRMILGASVPMKLTVADDDGEDMPDPHEIEFFSRRQHVLDVLSDRTVSLEERFTRLSHEYGIADTDRDLAQFYRGLERLDPAWDKYIERLNAGFVSVNDSLVWENLAVYLVYRHSGDYSLEESAAFAIHTVRLLCTISGDGDFETVCEVCRMWSAEIEYSEENTAAVMDILSR